MLLSWIQALLLSIAILGIPASLAFWVLAFRRMIAGQPLLPWTPRKPAPWQLVDLLIVVIVSLLAISAASGLMSLNIEPQAAEIELEDLPVDQQIGMLASIACASMFALMISFAIVRLRTGATIRDFGIDTTSILSDLRLSIVAFTMLTVPMLAIQGTLTFLIQPEDRHPFIDMILESPDFRFLGVITFSAIIVAPLTEEFLFRVLLLGWLERVVAFSNANRLLHSDRSESFLQTQHFPAEESDRATTSSPAPEAIGFESQAEEEIGSLPDSATVDGSGQYPGSAEIPENMPFWWIPIAVSGLLFGLAHWGQGVAPVALVFLGCGLGYIYQRTHRVLPCILVHFLVNLFAIAQMAFYIVQQDAS